MGRLDTLVYTSTYALASYDYDVREDGRRVGVVETVWYDDGLRFATPHNSTTEWEYDDLGRLVEESIDHYVDALDRSEHFAYDLAGNRHSRSLDEGDNGSIDATTVYSYDANDRLNSEVLDAVNNARDRSTTYGYDKTQQTSKDVHAGAAHVSLTTYGFNLQGRMEVVTVTTYASGVADRVERTTYEYSAGGARVESLHEVNADPGVDNVYETGARTSHLIDDANFTGYSQTARETTADRTTGQVQKVVVYATGLDQISQTAVTYSGGSPASEQTLVFGQDGHGSTRFLTGLDGAVVTVGVPQVFDYDAYGQLLNIDASQAATAFLYSGEAFEVAVGMQYLRARWYDPATGRVNGLDSFFGNQEDPQSLHKYLYTHGDPVNGSDPSGESLVSSLSSIAIRMSVGALVGGTVGGILGGIDSALGGDSFWEGARSGAVIGVALGAFGGLIAPLLPGTAPAWLVRTGAVINATGTTFAVGEALYKGNWKQGTFRLGISLLGFGGFKKLVANRFVKFVPEATGTTTSREEVFQLLGRSGLGRSVMKWIDAHGLRSKIFVSNHITREQAGGLRGMLTKGGDVVLIPANHNSPEEVAATLIHEIGHASSLIGSNQLSELLADFIPYVGHLGRDPIAVAARRLIEVVHRYDALPILFFGDSGVGVSLLAYVED